MSKIKISLIISFYLIMACSVVIAKEDAPIIRAFVDKKSIFIGDRIRYRVEAIKGKDVELELPRFEDSKIGDFEIKERGGNWYEITAYSVGKHQIPSIEIKFRRKGTKDWTSQKIGEMTIIVESVLPKRERPQDIKDIKGPIYFYEINWLVILGALAVVVLCILTIITYVRRKRKKSLKLPHETALEELEAIKAEFSRTGDVKEYYVKISDCVRHYIERVFRLRAPEMTTEEFLVSLKDSTILSSEEKDSLKGFLSSCDLVKFAKYGPSKSEIESIHSTAKNFIYVRV